MKAIPFMFELSLRGGAVRAQLEVTLPAALFDDHGRPVDDEARGKIGELRTSARDLADAILELEATRRVSIRIWPSITLADVDVLAERPR